MLPSALDFRKAASTGDLHKLVELYNQHGQSIIDLPGTPSGKTALHQAVINNQKKAVSQLIAWGADVNAKDSESNTPLILAYHHRHLESADILLDAPHLDVMHKNHAGQNAIMSAYVHGPSKINLLHEKFKSRLSEQFLELKKGNPQLYSLHIHPNGDIEFPNESLDVTLNRLSDFKRASVSSGSGGMRVIKNSQGTQFNFLDAPPAFSRPPLVFFIQHEDPTTVTLLRRHLLSLRSMGYQAVCLEYQADCSFERTLSDFDTTTHDDNMDNIQRDITARYADFMREFTHHGFHYHGIDAPTEIIQQHADPLKQDSYSAILLSEPVMRARNEYIAKAILQHANTYDGGIIVLVGGLQFALLNTLIIENRGTLKPFIFYEAHRQQKNALLLSGNNLQQRLNRSKVMHDHDLMEINGAALSPEEQDARLHIPLNNFFASFTPPLVHYKEEVNTTLSAKMKKINEDFQGLLREDFIVDAALAVSSPTVYHQYATTLREKMPYISTRMKQVQLGDGPPALSLVIDDINGGPNKKVIHKFTP